MAKKPFDLNLAAELMDVCVAVYMDDTHDKLEKLGYKVQLMIDEPSTDTQGAIMTNEHKIIVAFRGTTSSRDVLIDLNALVRPFPEGHPRSLVHQGFLLAHASVRNKVVDVLRGLLSSDRRRLIFTGHSLGAAIATLSAVEAAMVFERPVIIYTFASPMVGNGEFVKVFSRHVATSYRLELKGDPVPNIPLIGFEHVPVHVIFDEDCNFIVNPNFNEKFEETMDDIKHVLFGKAPNVHHHFNYQRVLEICRKKVGGV